jgi:hypothetical protein
MQSRGWLVEQIRVPAEEGLNIVAVKVGMTQQGPPDPQAAAAALEATVSNLDFTGAGAITTGASEVNSEIIQPSVKSAETVFGGIGVGVIVLAVVGGLVYLTIVFGGRR